MRYRVLPDILNGTLDDIRGKRERKKERDGERQRETEREEDEEARAIIYPGKVFIS